MNNLMPLTMGGLKNNSIKLSNENRRERKDHKFTDIITYFKILFIKFIYTLIIKI